MSARFKAGDAVLVRHDFPAAAQWLGRVAPSERQAELARRLAAVQAAMEPTP